MAAEGEYVKRMKHNEVDSRRKRPERDRGSKEGNGLTQCHLDSEASRATDGPRRGDRGPRRRGASPVTLVSAALWRQSVQVSSSLQTRLIRPFQFVQSLQLYGIWPLLVDPGRTAQ